MTAAVKARKGFAMELSDVQQQFDDVTRAKQEVRVKDYQSAKH